MRSTKRRCSPRSPQARSGLLDAIQSHDAEQMANANAQLTSSLGRLMVSVEAYPQLKADQGFLRLQDELTGTENRIAVVARRLQPGGERVQRVHPPVPHGAHREGDRRQAAEVFHGDRRRRPRAADRRLLQAPGGEDAANAAGSRGSRGLRPQLRLWARWGFGNSEAPLATRQPITSSASTSAKRCVVTLPGPPSCAHSSCDLVGHERREMDGVARELANDRREHRLELAAALPDSFASAHG